MSKPGSLLLLEDDQALSELITDEVEARGWVVEATGRLSAARDRLANTVPDLIVTDLRLPDGNGMEFVRDVIMAFPETGASGVRPGIIVITAFGSVPQAVEALQAGADDFLTKPLDLNHFMLTVDRVQEKRRMQHELTRFRELSAVNGFHDLLGDSPAMRSLFEQIQVIGRAGGPVLLRGESGTGKELVARALCQESERADKPFVAVNCAGIPQDLMESELFGHAAGAFTGASRARQGIFHQADGGTLLLDEIAELPLPMQAKLLRVLQDGSIRRVGEDLEEQVNVRVIAASHQNLYELAQQGDFREDLYYRLETFAIQLPPLRERGEDIEILAERFLAKTALAHGRSIRGFSRAALRRLRGYPFPGNIRELQNIVERAAAFCDQDWVDIEHLPARVNETSERKPETSTHIASGLPSPTGDTTGNPVGELFNGTVWPSMEELQTRYVRLVLDQVNGNKRRAAALLGIGRKTLYRWLEQAGEQEHDQ